MSQKFKCHINVETCVSIAAVKYVYKYIYKGNDRADVLIHEVWYQDEIKSYINARYVFAETTIMMIMFCLNIRLGKGSDWKTLRRNPIQQAILPFPPQPKRTMNVSIFMLYCFLVRICHSAACIRMFNLLLSFHFLENYRICIWQGMKTVGMSGKICLLLRHFVYKIYLTTAMPLHPCNTKMQPPARRGEFVFRICRQIGHYDSHFHAGPKENQLYQKL